MFGDCLGALDFTETSKNNGIIIALTTRGEERDTLWDQQTEKEGGREEVMSAMNRQ